jgi:hypothetical protein
MIMVMILKQKFFYLPYLFVMVLVRSSLHVIHGNEDMYVNEDISDFGPHNDTSSECTVGSSCPTWSYCSSGSCRCGENHHDIIHCKDESNIMSGVLDCNCVTYDEATGSTFVGACFYNCVNNIKMDRVYHILPRKPTELMNDSVCNWFNRKGLLCGDCEDGFSPFVLSYNISCVNCTDGYKNWWKFSVIAFAPVTFFYLFVVIFQINVTSSHLHGVVWFSQTISIPSLVRIAMVKLAKGYPHVLIVVRAFAPLYTIWNLDLFRSIIPDTCLNVSPLQALALDYVVAFYPLVLISLSYCMIVLYEAKVTPIRVIWTPFRKFFTLFRRTWDVRTSLIDSFASIYLLSYVKILNVSMDLLIPTRIYKLNSNDVMYGLYYVPTVPYFGKYHLPYAVLALVVLVLFVSLPTMILLLYPFRFFQRLLTLFSINWYSLRIYVDSFQGCYKDGTEPGTFDCRWFSALMLLTRLLYFIIYGLTLSIMFFTYALILVITVLILLINIQPYKKTAVRYPSTDTTFFFLLILFYSAILGMDSENTMYSGLIFVIICVVSACIPLFYIIFFVLSWLIKTKREIKT